MSDTRGVSCGESKAGAGPVRARMGARQGRAAKFATANLERLTDSLHFTLFSLKGVY
jgi:hypothetical protein